jgi:hypothetical protein
MSVIIWQGFDHYWQLEPHRLNRFGSYIDLETSDADRTGQGNYISEMAIGRAPPDICHAHTMIHRVGTSTTRRIDGEVTLEASGQLGERVEVAGDVIRHPLPGENVTATVVMRGFALHSTSFSHGFQTRGFGFLLDEIEQRAEDGSAYLSFRPRAFIHPDRSPDPFTDPDRFVWRIMPFPAELEPHNPGSYTYQMTLYYSVIYDAADCVALTSCDVDEEVRSNIRQVSEPVTIVGTTDDVYETASLGIRGFGWELLDWPRTRYNGRYLRRLKFIIDGMLYEQAAGRMSFHPKMAFTNFGGRQGRERVRWWLRLLRNHERSRRQRFRAAARALRGSTGFHAKFTMNTTLLQFQEGSPMPVMRLYNVVRRDETVSQSFDLPY